MTDVKRKGARSAREIPQEILKQLNNGRIETANLVEWLAVDQIALLESFLRQNHRKDYLAPICTKIRLLKKQTVNAVGETIGAGIFEHARKSKDTEVMMLMANHPSDMIRCWAAYSVGKRQELNVEEALQQIMVFAADKHFGVREISWLAVRGKIKDNLEKSIAVLSKWTESGDEYIRRFASEATRPRGVWCVHIEALKKDPGQALPILESLKADRSRYVQDSVGNWLNDAGKTQPGFTRELCRRWEKESTGKETKYIVKRALRTIGGA